jgi:hypothetical protein
LLASICRLITCLLICFAVTLGVKDIESLSSGTPFDLSHFLQFGDLYKKANVNLKSNFSVTFLAWIVINFAPFVTGTSGECSAWEGLRDNKPINSYMTSSDLAFLFLISEHHFHKWKHLGQYRKANNGADMPQSMCQKSYGLLYPGGIAGKAAKERYKDLHVHFHKTFFVDSPEARENMELLSWSIAEITTHREPVALEPLPSQQQVVDDILHHVFYHFHLE